jgi:hypothetical protein
LFLIYQIFQSFLDHISKSLFFFKAVTMLFVVLKFFLRTRTVNLNFFVSLLGHIVRH